MSIDLDEDDFSDLDDLEEWAPTLATKDALKPPEPAKPEPKAKKQRESLPLIDVEGTKDSEPIRRTLISGHCNFPGRDKDASHARCKGFSRANPDKTFQPCPCTCHFPEDRYECDACGGVLVEAEHYPLDEDGDVRYVHYDPTTRRISRAACG